VHLTLHSPRPIPTTFPLFSLSLSLFLFLLSLTFKLKKLPSKERTLDLQYPEMHSWPYGADRAAAFWRIKVRAVHRNLHWNTKYEGESTGNLKIAIKIRSRARLSFKLTTIIFMVWRVADDTTWSHCVPFVFNKLRDKTYSRFLFDSPSYCIFSFRIVRCCTEGVSATFVVGLSSFGTLKLGSFVQ